MKDLIEKLAQADGPSRELDAEIAPLMGLRIVNEGHPIGRVCYDANGHGVPLPAYTASIDAALTLVPEGWWVSWMTVNCPSIGNSCILAARDGAAASASDAVTPAIALCIAALSAKEPSQ